MSPDVHNLGAINFFTFEMRNTGQSVNFVWGGVKWFLPNPGNVILGTQ